MAHTISKVNVGNNALVIAKITDYVAGGETFTLAELGLSSIVNIIMIVDPSAQIFPVLSGGKVILTYTPTATPTSKMWAEVPTTVGLNYVFAALVQGTN